MSGKGIDVIYILTVSKICPGEPTGIIDDLLVDVFDDVQQARKAFDDFELSALYFYKELWLKDDNEKRKLLRRARYERVGS